MMIFAFGFATYDLSLQARPLEIKRERRRMAISARHETAKIHQFPISARATAVSQQRPKVNLTPDIGASIATAAFDSWYHEAAITETDPSRKQ